MKSSQIYDLIELIAASPKKTEKERLLKEADCPELRRVLVACYNPRINYYVKKVPSSGVHQNENFSDLTWLMLDSLSKRDVTGNEALDQLEATLDFLNTKSKELLARIIKRDLRAGFSVSTINKCFPKIVDEVPYMRCSLLSKVDTSGWGWGTGVFSQTKLDGMFCNLSVIDNETVVMTSRQGTEFPIEEFVDLVEHMSEFAEAGYQYHGELVVIDTEGNVLPREIGNGMFNSVLKGGVIPDGHYPKFIVWDMVELDVIEGRKKSDKPYHYRYDRVNEIQRAVFFHAAPTRIIHSLDEAYQHYRELLEQGQEGSIIKNPNMLWRDGTSKEQLKLKLEFEVDLKIVGFTQGNGKNANTFGSISMESSDGLLKVDVSGMSDDLRMYAHLHRDELLGTIATVKANDITKSSPASLYLPRLVDFRSFEKSEADSFDQIVEQRENAKRGGK